MSTTEQIAYLEGGDTGASTTTTAAPTSTPAPAQTSSTTTSTSSTEKKDDVRKPRVCVSVIKGEACRTQMEGKHCPYNHEGAPAPETLTRVYICHLPLNYGNDDIQKLASPFGKIQESRVLVDPRTNLSRGVAFIHYEKHEEAEASIKALNEMKLPNHATPLAARYARRNRPSRRGASGRRRRSRSRSPPRRRRFRSPPRRSRMGGRRPRRDYYDDEYDEDYDYDNYYPRRPRHYDDEAYDPYGPSDRGYAPYGRNPPSAGRPGNGYTTYTPPTVTVSNTAGGYSSQSGSTGRVDGYRSYPQTSQYSTSGYGAPSGQRY